MGQAVVSYCSVLSSWGVSRLIKQEQGNLYWLHEEGADDTAKARHGLKAAQGQCQPLDEHQECCTSTVLHQLHVKQRSFAKTDHRQPQHTQNASLTRFHTVTAQPLFLLGIYSSAKALWMKN